MWYPLPRSHRHGSLKPPSHRPWVGTLSTEQIEARSLAHGATIAPDDQGRVTLHGHPNQIVPIHTSWLVNRSRDTNPKKFSGPCSSYFLRSCSRKDVRICRSRSRLPVYPRQKEKRPTEFCGRGVCKARDAYLFCPRSILPLVGRAWASLPPSSPSGRPGTGSPRSRPLQV